LLNGKTRPAERVERFSPGECMRGCNEQTESERVSKVMNLTSGQRKIFAVTWITYSGFYLCRKNLSIALPLLAGVAGLRSMQLANIVFGYSLLYAVGQFGFGFLSDRIGPKRVVGTGLLIIIGSSVMMVFTPQ
jgi:sugar phosphate permease